jgi:tetratricopeptide (TPR) repeat protein
VGAQRGAIAVAILSLFAACASGARDEGTVAPPRPPPVAVAVLPNGDGDFAPSLLRVERAAAKGGATVADVETCGDCHGDIEAQWRASAHAFASFNNPIYRTAIDRLRKDRGTKASRFCAGCHDIALLVDGAMDGDIEPKDRRAHAGVSCRVCHGVTATRPDGNGSYTLDLGEFPVPKEGDAESVRKHKARAAASPLRTASLCASCHKAFLHEGTGNDHFMIGQDDATPWARSAYAGSLAERVDATIAPKECRACHMPPEDANDPTAKGGKVASHRFTGAHTWLAQMRGDREQRRRVEEELSSAVTLDVAAVVPDGGARVLPPEDAALTPGGRAIVEVVVRNVGAGHRFPGGVLDAQDTWLEVTIEDARGQRVAEAGTRQEATGDDPTAHRFTAAVAGADGRPLLARETHLFEAGVYDHTIAPRDAAVARFAFDVPRGGAGLLHAVARLRHRSRRLALQKAACDDARSARGRAFGQEGIRRVARAIDPCPPQPVTDLARAEAMLGVGSPAAGEHRLGEGARAFQRAFDHGLAMLHEVGERQGEARPSLERALARARDDRERAMALGALARLAEEQGRTAEALDLLGKADALVPAHPALARLRGETQAISWRWGDAAPSFQEATVGAPKDDALWARLAVLWGGAGRDRDALEAAQRGLLLQPRDADMLRVQALALRSLGAPVDLVARADDAFVAHRAPDVAPRVRSRCTQDVPGCALERLPVHVHEMRR